MEFKKSHIWMVRKISNEPLVLASREHKPLMPSTEEPPTSELKALPQYLKYAYLGSSETLPIITVANIPEEKEEELMNMLRDNCNNLDL